MPVSEQIKALFEKLFPKKRMRRTEWSASKLRFLESSKAISMLIFVLAVILIAGFSFVGIKSSSFQILPNQQSTIRISASETFAYPSKIRTDRKKSQIANDVPHIYSINLTPYMTFATRISALQEEMNNYNQIEQDLSVDGAKAYIKRMAAEFNSKGDHQLSEADLAAILEFPDKSRQSRMIQSGLLSLEQSFKGGIYDPDDKLFSVGENSGSHMVIEGSDGEMRLADINSIEAAMRDLRVSMISENVPRRLAEAYINLFEDGVESNLIRNATQMEHVHRQLLDQMEQVIVRVEEGASIIEPNTRVSEEQYEQYVAYQRYMDDKSEEQFDLQLAGRMLLVLAMLMAATFYIRLVDRETLESNSRLGLIALVVLANLIIIRITLELGNLEMFRYDSGLSSILPYITPTALAPVIVAILIGSGPGLLTALMISLFTAVMFGNRLDLLVMSFLASTVAIFVCRNIRKRGRVVTGGFAAGASIALFTLLFNYVDQLPMQTIANQMIGGLITGLAEGVVIVGVLPILEGLFRRTTDITLLELSDYNHPLLRRMQFEAPGTWHHSLMVANLAENASNAIGINGLLARVSCMFHDIGKMVKPEYFTENQRDGINPHDERTPSFSALVIKSHVKEGVDLGLTYKLPRPIISIIRQHHGTNLIRFFFHKAKKQSEDEKSVSESTYRYDGPKPQFKESAVILLADSLEAASRSLPKVTPQNIEELVDRIFKVNIEDGQFDECPITLAELSKIRESFIFTLLNSLHSRIAYPDGKGSQAKPSPKADERKPERVEASAGK